MEQYTMTEKKFLELKQRVPSEYYKLRVFNDIVLSSQIAQRSALWKQTRHEFITGSVVARAIGNVRYYKTSIYDFICE
jgi:hypothetical protein